MRHGENRLLVAEARLQRAVVAAGADPGTGRAGGGRAEHARRLGPQLGQQRVRADAGDAGNRHEQVQRVHVRGQRGLDARVQRVKPRRGRVEIVQQAAEAPQRLRVERRGQGEFQLVALALHMAREARQDALGRAPLAQAFENRVPVGAEDVGQHHRRSPSQSSVFCRLWRTRARSATTLRRYPHCWRSALKAGGGT